SVEESTTSDDGLARPVVYESTQQQPSASDRRRYRLRSQWLYAGVGLFMGLCVLYGFDLVHSIGRVPRGAEVAGIQVGGMRTEDAEAKLVSELGPRVDDGWTCVPGSWPRRSTRRPSGSRWTTRAPWTGPGSSRSTRSSVSSAWCSPTTWGSRASSPTPGSPISSRSSPCRQIGRAHV